MDKEEFETVCRKLKGHTENFFFHVMGEPLLHPQLDELLKIASTYGYKVSITTNGTLLKKAADVLISNRESIHRVSISLHAPEGNGRIEALDEYLDAALDFANKFSSVDKNVVFRLWNLDTAEKTGENSLNSKILERLKSDIRDIGWHTEPFWSLTAYSPGPPRVRQRLSKTEDATRLAVK